MWVILSISLWSVLVLDIIIAFFVDVFNEVNANTEEEWGDEEEFEFDRCYGDCDHDDVVLVPVDIPGYKYITTLSVCKYCGWHQIIVGGKK